MGASGGIGSAIAAKLSERGTEVVPLSRSANGLEVTDEASVERVISGVEGPFDAIIVTTGALVIDGHEPEKTLRQVTPEGLRKQFDTNTVGPAMVLKHALAHLSREGRAVVAVLSARVGSIGDNDLGGWYAYRTAKAAVNQIVRCTAIELGRTHRAAICVALHPGTVATRFTSDYAGRYTMVAPEEAAENLLRVIDGLTPEDTGRFFDWRGDPVPW